MRHSGPFVKMRDLLICLCLTSNMLQRMGAAAEEMKHNLPGNLEIIDPKSLGLGDADLEKFLGNVKVLPINGQTGHNVKTEILTVGFDGNEKLNLADFDGLSTDGLPDQEKQVAHAAFQSFQNFFRNPSTSQNFDDAVNNNRPPNGHHVSQNHHMNQNHQPHLYQEPPRMQPYNQNLQNQAQRPQYQQQRNIYREMTEAPRPASHGGGQPNQYYRLNPQEVGSLLTATEASTGRAKAPQIYSLNESAFPRHLAKIMGISTSIERPRAMQPPQLPPARPHQHVQSQPIYVTQPPQVQNVQRPTGSQANHNPYHHQFQAGPTHNAHNVPQQQQRPHSDTRYTATSSIQQNHYVPLQPRPTIQTSTHKNPYSPNHFGSHNAHQQPTLPTPQGTYKPPVGQPPRQPQHQIQHSQPQQQHPATYYSQNYVLQPSVGFQVPNPLPSPHSPLTTPRGITGHIDQGKSNRPTGQQIFHQATAASTHTPASHTQQYTQPPVNHNQYQQQHHQGMPFVQIVRQNHAKTMKDVFSQQSLSQHQQNNVQAGSNMLAQIQIHHANHKHPTILNIHQPQPPHQQPAKSANNYQQQQQQHPQQQQQQHPQQQQQQQHQQQHQQQQQQTQQHYKLAQPFINGHVDIYPQQNNVQVNPGPQAFQVPGFVRHNSHELAAPTSHHQRPQQNHPGQPASENHNLVANPTAVTPSNSLAPPILIATTQPPFYRPEVHGNPKGTHYTGPYHVNSLIQGAPSHLHAQHLLPNSYQQTLLERQRETERRPPAPPPHPPPPSIPYRASHVNEQSDYRAPRTLAEASLPRRFKYEEWPLHRSDRADVDTDDSIQNHIDSSADLDEEGSEHAIAITKQLFDPDMIETIQPAQMIAYGHVTTSEKPEEQ